MISGDKRCKLHVSPKDPTGLRCYRHQICFNVDDDFEKELKEKKVIKYTDYDTFLASLIDT